MELEDLDLNLLVVFNQLLIERKVSKVAENLGLGQPAVSNALARMRKLFGDELFLRTSRGMEPTPFAAQLAESVTAGLGMIHGAINRTTTFEPATSQRRFAIGMTDIGEIYFLPRLMKEIARIAPAVTITTVRNSQACCRNSTAASSSAGSSCRSTSACSARATRWTNARCRRQIFLPPTMWPSFLQARGTARSTRSSTARP